MTASSRICPATGAEEVNWVSLPRDDDRWIWVNLPRATFGIVVRDGKVVDAAPYGRGRGLRLAGMDEHAAAEKLKRLGAEFVALP